MSENGSWYYSDILANDKLEKRGILEGLYFLVYGVEFHRFAPMVMYRTSIVFFKIFW